MKRTPPRLAVVIVALLLAFLQIGTLGLALDKLGLTPESAASLLATMLFGSFVNVPLFSLRADSGRQREASWEILHPPSEARNFPVPDRIVVSANVGGCLTPVSFSVYLLLHTPLAPGSVFAAVAVVTATTYTASFPVPRVGIVTPVLAAPLAAASLGLIVDPEHAPILAYIAGTLGVLIGADLMHLGEVRRLGGPSASIGGAGTFDGIFLSGIIAALLA